MDHVVNAINTAATINGMRVEDSVMFEIPEII